jgi:hypothetical protein
MKIPDVSSWMTKLRRWKLAVTTPRRRTGRPSAACSGVSIRTVCAVESSVSLRPCPGWEHRHAFAMSTAGSQIADPCRRHGKRRRSVAGAESGMERVCIAMSEEREAPACARGYTWRGRTKVPQSPPGQAERRAVQQCASISGCCSLKNSILRCSRCLPIAAAFPPPVTRILRRADEGAFSGQCSRPGFSRSHVCYPQLH